MGDGERRKEVDFEIARPLGAIVPAAGESRRMGTLKQLLPWADGRTILETVLFKLARPPVAQLIVVLGHEEKTVRQRLEDGPLGLLFQREGGRPAGGLAVQGEMVINPAYQRGMLSSIKAGLTRLEPTLDGFLLCPGDHPAFSLRTVEELVRVFAEGSAGIVIPTYRGRRGHPALFARHFVAEIMNLPEELGLRELSRRHPEEVREVDLDDPGILTDLDHPEDYARFRP